MNGVHCQTSWKTIVPSGNWLIQSTPSSPNQPSTRLMRPNVGL